MKIRYLVPKEYISQPPKAAVASNLPADVQIKLMDQEVLSQTPVQYEEPDHPKYTPDTSYIPKYLRGKADWMIRELLSRGVRWNDKGELLQGNVPIVGSNILSLVNDALFARKGSNPVGWLPFAQLLQQHNIPAELIKNPRSNLNLIRVEAEKNKADGLFPASPQVASGSHIKLPSEKPIGRRRREKSIVHPRKKRKASVTPKKHYRTRSCRAADSSSDEEQYVGF